MHGVSIHYKEMKILITIEGEFVIFKGVKSRSLPRVISALQALRSVRKGCQAFLASVMDIIDTFLCIDLSRVSRCVSRGFT